MTSRRVRHPHRSSSPLGLGRIGLQGADHRALPIQGAEILHAGTPLLRFLLSLAIRAGLPVRVHGVALCTASGSACLYHVSLLVERSRPSAPRFRSPRLVRLASSDVSVGADGSLSPCTMPSSQSAHPAAASALREGGAVGAQEAPIHMAAPRPLPFVVALHHLRDLHLFDCLSPFERRVIAVELFLHDGGVRVGELLEKPRVLSDGIGEIRLVILYLLLESLLEVRILYQSGRSQTRLLPFELVKLLAGGARPLRAALDGVVGDLVFALGDARG